MRSFEVGMRALLITMVAIGLAFEGAAFAVGPSAEKGAQIMAQCAACHGSDGLSVDTSIPNLAGQHYPYLVAQMNAYKHRTRISPLMNAFARPLSQEQIEDISAYYASVPLQINTAAKPKQ